MQVSVESISKLERRMQVQVPAERVSKEIAARLKKWRAPKPRYTRGVLAKYAAHVTSASLGAVTDADLKL